MHVRDLLLSIGFILTGCDKASEPAEGARGIEDRCAPSQLPCLIINRLELENGGTVNDEGELQGRVVRIAVYRCDPERTSVSEAGPQRLAVQCTALVEPWEDHPGVRGGLLAQPGLEAELDLQIDLPQVDYMRITGQSTINGASHGPFEFAGYWNIEDDPSAVSGYVPTVSMDPTLGWLGDATFHLEVPAAMILQPPMWPPD
jgi:hypothetical protein